MKRIILLLIVLFNISYAELKAPDFQLKDEDGKIVKLSDLKNDVVLITFWATTCHSCKKELPELQSKLYPIYKDKVKFYAIVIDTDNVSKIKQVKKEWGFSFPVLIGNYEVMEKYRIIGTPITYIIGKDNKIVKIFIGPQDINKFKEVLEKALKS
ncbi:MAG TPA: TlpA family protein disulfide reductase [Sulfurihydrogenibium sp.]|uniref:redoxin domain-containing protein n=1 Tax=Sulfurihydrogenibium sp. (strain YO3AOP1) TaxID=436114 RepID=UPI0001726239|nr:TlpA disulfide reductase family protein [Sulfurihydrogenibium sp. YO3AOP1]ACD65828.1 Redoxin domain protein [Sulfurihydrogenibium sp. YO3AOP1]HBT97909.1 TlpA family protein disulfide reductase [Sulfurihydrogenibium sp.]